MARAAAGLHRDLPDRSWRGTALETMVYHELRVFNETAGRHRGISYYRTPSGVEIDFVVETRKRRAGSPPRVVAIEVRLSPKWNRSWEKPMMELAAQPGVKVDRCFGVYTGSRAYDFQKVRVFPVTGFLTALYAGDVF